MAEAGGKRVRVVPYPSWPVFDDELIESAANVFRSGKVNYWTGTEGRRFEEELAESAGTKYAIVLANGTVALEGALKAVGVGPGTEVITTSRTFLASATAAVSLGAVPRFADVDPVTQNITAETIEPLIGPKTRAIVAVHLAGWPCDMKAIVDLARRKNIAVVEDCAQANGARIDGKSVGSFGDVAAWSFCQDKIVTTGGEGGAITTDDYSIWNAIWSLKDHGKSFDVVYNRQHPPGFRWLHESFGSNWRMTEAQSAMGRIQLRRLESWVSTRRAHAAELNEAFRAEPALRLTLPPEGIYHSYYKYYVFVRPSALRDGWTRDRIMNAITAEGVPCFSGSCSEIYLEKCFVDAGMTPTGRLPVARELGETSLMFPVHPTLEKSDIQDTISAVRKVLAVATA